MPTLNFYRTSSDPRTLIKSVGTARAITGTFRIPLDMYNPVVLIEESIMTMEQYLSEEWNYVTYQPQSGSRKFCYFINGAKVINGKLIELSMRMDVLGTYADDILACKGFVERNAVSYDPLIEDKLRPLRGRKTAGVSPLRKPYYCTDFTTATEWDSAPADAGGSIALTVFVNNDSLDEICDDLRNRYPTDFPSSMSNVDVLHKLTCNDVPFPYDPTDQEAYIDPMNTDKTNPSRLITYMVSPRDFLRIVNQILFSGDNVMSGFVSAVAFPLDYQKLTWCRWAVDVYCNDTKITSIPGISGGIPKQYVACLGQRSRYVMIRDHNVGSPSSYRDFEPYSTYEIYLPYVGLVPISSTNWFNHRIAMYYELDLTTGDGTAYLSDIREGNVPIFSQSCHVGTRLSVSSTNERENQNARTASALNTAVGLVSSMIGIAGGVVAGNPLVAGASALGGVKAITGAISTNLNILERSQTSLNTPASGNYARQIPYLRKTNVLPTFADYGVEDRIYRACYGAPYNEACDLNTMQGFTIVSALELDSASFRASEQVKNEIRRLLAEGVYFPYSS